jgi:hypothetical protein
MGRAAGQVIEGDTITLEFIGCDFGGSKAMGKGET